MQKKSKNRTNLAICSCKTPRFLSLKIVKIRLMKNCESRLGYLIWFMTQFSNTSLISNPAFLSICYKKPLFLKFPYKNKLLQLISFLLQSYYPRKMHYFWLDLNRGSKGFRRRRRWQRVYQLNSSEKYIISRDLVLIPSKVLNFSRMVRTTPFLPVMNSLIWTLKLS